MFKKKTVQLALLLLALITTTGNATLVTVNYELTLSWVRSGSGLEDFFGETAHASITYDLQTIGVVHPMFSNVTVYENAITNYSVSSINIASGFNLSVTGSNSDIQIQDNISNGRADRIRSPYKHNGSTNVPLYSTSTEVGIVIDQLYNSNDIFDSMALPQHYPSTLDGIWNNIGIYLSSQGSDASYDITRVSQDSTVPEPSTALLVLVGLIGVSNLYQRKRNVKA